MRDFAPGFVRKIALICSVTLLLAGQSPGESGLDRAAQLLKDHQYEAAAQAYGETVKFNPNDDRAYAGLVAIDLEYYHDYERAERNARKALELNPNSAEHHCHLAAVLGVKVMRGGMLTAMRLAPQLRGEAEKALALDPSYFTARIYLMQYYLAAPAIAGGGKGKTRKLAEETIALNPAQGLRLRANVHFAEKQPDLAEQDLVRSRELDPGSPDVYNALGYLYVNTKRYDQALAAFRKYIELAPDDPNGYDSYGDGLWARNEFRQAAEQYRKAIAINPRFVEPVFKLGKACAQLGDTTGAIAQFERSREIDPQGPYAKPAEQRIKRLRTGNN